MAVLEAGQLLSDSHRPVIFCTGGRGDAESVRAGKIATLGERD